MPTGPQHYTFTEDSVRKTVGAVRRFEGRPNNVHSILPSLPKLPAGPNVPVYNGALSDCPSYGVMLVNGGQQFGGTNFVKAKQPDKFGCQWDCLVAHFGGIGATSYGGAQPYTPGVPVIAAYDSADGTPAAGESWGPQSGTWLLKKNTGGFRVIQVVDSGNHYVQVLPDAFLEFHATADADIAVDTTGTVSIFYRSGATAYTDTTFNATALNDLDGTVSSGKDCRCRFESYMNSGTYTEGWVIYQADCS